MKSSSRFTTRVAALILVLLLHLHKAQASTCQSGDCNGLIISGGIRTETDIEVFPAKRSCPIPPFPPAGREKGFIGHTLSVINGTLVACGGWGLRGCSSWQPGKDTWEDYGSLVIERAHHGAVVVESEDDIMIAGGRRSSGTGEFAKSTKQFFLKNTGTNRGSATCAVSYQGEFVMMGGGLHRKVDRFDFKGNYLGPLPDLIGQRENHACTTFTSSNGEEGLLVVGGWSGSRFLSTTELYLPSNQQWTQGGDLPRKMSGLRAAFLNGKVVVTGGHDQNPWQTSDTYDEVYQYEETAEKWSEIGKMKKARGNHAIVAINLDIFCPGTGDAGTTTSNTSLLALAIFSRISTFLQ